MILAMITSHSDPYSDNVILVSSRKHLLPCSDWDMKHSKAVKKETGRIGTDYESNTIELSPKASGVGKCFCGSVSLNNFVFTLKRKISDLQITRDKSQPKYQV